MTTNLKLLLLEAFSFVCWRTCLKEPLLMVVLFVSRGMTSTPMSCLICLTLSSNSSFSGSQYRGEYSNRLWPGSFINLGKPIEFVLAYKVSKKCSVLSANGAVLRVWGKC